MSANNNPDLGNDMSHRLTHYQIQHLEANFIQLPHPDENQRTHIARQLELDVSHVTSWFHNKRNQRTVLHPPSENDALRTENHSIRGASPEAENFLNELASRAARALRGQQSESSSDVSLINSQILTAASGSLSVVGLDMKILRPYLQLALSALVLLCRDIEPLWVTSGTNRGFSLHLEEYLKRFPNSLNIPSTRLQFESSKDSILVPLKASDLAGMFFDMNQWADLFPTIVKEAKSEALVTRTFRGPLHLMYGQMHILSPLLVPREFIFLRYRVPASDSPDTWYIVDVRYDCLISNQAQRPSWCWCFPSGVMIQSLPDAKSKVTWVEHVKLNASLDHPDGNLWKFVDMKQPDGSTSYGYGATRWLSSLYRMTERSLYSVLPRSTSFPVLEGRKNLMTFSLKMIRDFCSIPRNLSKSSNPGVRMSVRKGNNNEPGQPHFTIMAASTSVWLPLTFKDLFNFLRDESMRPKWDVMNNRAPFSNIMNFPTGTEPGNCISVIQSDSMKETSMCLLQESSIDPICALVIFTPLRLPKMMDISIGEDTSDIQLLSSGFLISGEGSRNGNGSDGASTSEGTTSRSSGSLLTLAIQWIVQDSESALKENGDKLSNIVTSTINHIRMAMNCHPYMIDTVLKLGCLFVLFCSLHIT